MRRPAQHVPFADWALASAHAIPMTQTLPRGKTLMPSTTPTPRAPSFAPLEGERPGRRALRLDRVPADGPGAGRRALPLASLTRLTSAVRASDADTTPGFAGGCFAWVGRLEMPV
jgi:hypothetical protein